jgi:hypothetical protein
MSELHILNLKEDEQEAKNQQSESIQVLESHQSFKPLFEAS